ncbi:plant/protein (DUF789) [Rhynchospora pubera]|uniref:Plant/protein (DUF789) n=1 Tax=Rhynchospora pubera TaxID=906938 RepID=A0AAV8BPM1_9POAL|nr:plant/protein (DUF789) [Rhynchospora pubera]
MAAKRSNLQCFLDSVTPAVEPHFLSEGGENSVKCFILSDLWESLYEWSVYGVGTDVVLPNDETIVQYFVPHLSAIQLYTNKKFLATSRNFGSHNQMCCYASEYHKKELSPSCSTFSNDVIFTKEDLENATKNLGYKYFEYFEMSPSNIRMPLVDKVRELAQNFPDLDSLKSIELSPASWMSIYWYPIYMIPAQFDIENYDACFLTYHSLSSSFQVAGIHETFNPISKLSNRTSMKLNDKNMTISLPPFGLATLKAKGALWNNPETGDSALAASLHSAAGFWLQQVQAHHHDFDFFTNH